MPAPSDPLRVRFHQFGPPADVLQVEPLELPPLDEGMVRVRMLAAPINPADLNFIEGVYGVKPELPATPGIEGCGEIIESREPGWEPGTRVILLGRLGAWADLLDARPADLLKVPAGIDPVQAAMLKINPLTAWILLGEGSPPPPGSWIAQNAANSGVGRCLIQLAKQAGLRTINLVRRPELVAELSDLGADVVLLDGEETVARALEATAGERPAIAANAVGGDSALRLMHLLADGGSLVTYGAMGRRPLKVPNSFLIFRGLSLTGLWVTHWLQSARREELESRYAHLAEMVMQGSFIQPVDCEFSLRNVQAAVSRAAEPGRNGKVILC